MARNLKPKLKQLKRFGLAPSNGGSITKKKSLHGGRMEEKQKIKFLYGVMEKQFRNYIKKAKNSPGNALENLVLELEIRLDNVVYRAGLAKSRPHARQLVGHGHVLINGKKVDVPSYQVSIGETVSIKIATYDTATYQLLLKERENIDIPSWIQVNENSAKILRIPSMDDPHEKADYRMIFEFYR